MQNLLGYGGESYVREGVIRHYVGNARLSWVDCDDVAAVAVSCLTDPERHSGETYRLGYEVKSFGEVAATFTDTLEVSHSLMTHVLQRSSFVTSWPRAPNLRT